VDEISEKTNVEKKAVISNIKQLISENRNHFIQMKKIVDHLEAPDVSLSFLNYYILFFF
jgi:hypothetical protein